MKTKYFESNYGEELAEKIEDFIRNESEVGFQNTERIVISLSYCVQVTQSVSRLDTHCAILIYKENANSTEK